jgi:ABC-type lipopolysaccharide export system ATPase subunit
LHVGKVVANDTAANVSANDNLRQYYLGLVE